MAPTIEPGSESKAVQASIFDLSLDSRVPPLIVDPGILREYGPRAAVVLAAAEAACDLGMDDDADSVALLTGMTRTVAKRDLTMLSESGIRASARARLRTKDMLSKYLTDSTIVTTVTCLLVNKSLHYYYRNNTMIYSESEAPPLVTVEPETVTELRNELVLRQKWGHFVSACGLDLVGMHTAGFKSSGQPKSGYARLVRVASQYSGRDPDTSARLWSKFVDNMKTSDQWQWVTENNAAEKFGRWLHDSKKDTGDVTIRL